MKAWEAKQMKIYECLSDLEDDMQHFSDIQWNSLVDCTSIAFGSIDQLTVLRSIAQAWLSTIDQEVLKRTIEGKS